MRRVVSLTHNAIERDTRALKIAASAARLGYESIALEAEPSALDPRGLPFELRPLARSGGADNRPEEGDGGGGSPAQPVRPGLLARLAARLPRPLGPLRPALRWASRAIGEPLRLLGAYLLDNLALARRLPPADLYLLHSAYHFPSVYLRARRRGARLVYDAHDANWALDPAVDASAPSRQTLKLMELTDKICVRRVDAYLAVGAALGQLLESHFGRPAVVVRNCHDFRLDEPPANDLRAVAGVPADAFLLVMTGAPKPGDTVEAAFDALAMLPDRIHLALIGNGQQGRRTEVAARRLEGRVHLLEAVPPTQVASFIRTADASPILYRALSPAYEVSLPNRFFHAVAAGLPILYPPLPEIKALCREYEMGLEIDATSPDSIRRTVLALEGDPELRGKLAANVERAQSELSWEHEEKILAGELERALTL